MTDQKPKFISTRFNPANVLVVILGLVAPLLLISWYMARLMNDCSAELGCLAYPVLWLIYVVVYVVGFIIFLVLTSKFIRQQRMLDVMNRQIFARIAVRFLGFLAIIAVVSTIIGFVILSS